MFGLALNDKDKKSQNALVSVDSQGNIVNVYTKIHPFSYTGEDAKFVLGNDLTVTTFGSAQIDNTIFYDLRFPELYIAYSTKK